MLGDLFALQAVGLYQYSHKNKWNKLELSIDYQTLLYHFVIITIYVSEPFPYHACPV